MSFLWKVQVKLKEFKPYATGLTDEIRDTVRAVAQAAGRPVQYLDTPTISKEDFARRIAQDDGVTEGLICVVTSVEPCFSHEVRRNARTKHLELRRGRSRGASLRFETSRIIRR